MPIWKPLLAGLCLLPSVAGPAGAAQTLRIGLADNPDMLDPSMARTFTGRVVFAALCDKLLDISPELDIVPQLASEWRWTDGNLLILLFSVTSGLLPASGFVSPAESLSHNLATLVMPAFVLGNAIAAAMMRHTRSAMLRVLGADYVPTARAKGLSEARVVLHHALRNALIPVITLAALDFGALLSGAVLTEQVFTIPGFGKLIVDAVFNRDYAVVQGVVLCAALAYICSICSPTSLTF
jgi:hypothetical protein